MITVELLRTVFRGVILFMVVGVGGGIAAAIWHLTRASNLPDEHDRRVHTMRRNSPEN